MISRSQEAQIEAGKQEIELFGGPATQAIEDGSFLLDAASVESRVTDPATLAIEDGPRAWEQSAKLLKAHSLFNRPPLRNSVNISDSLLRRSG